MTGPKAADDEAEKLNPADAAQLERRLSPIFAGYYPSAQGAALAALTATFMAGVMIVHGDPDKQEQMRKSLLSQHLNAIQGLIPEAMRLIRQRLTEERQKAEQAKRVN